jgi:hypothetical protein
MDEELKEKLIDYFANKGSDFAQDEVEYLHNFFDTEGYAVVKKTGDCISCNRIGFCMGIIILVKLVW